MNTCPLPEAAVYTAEQAASDDAPSMLIRYLTEQAELVEHREKQSREGKGSDA